MDMMAMVSSILAMQSAGTQQQIQTSIIKQNMDAEKAAVQTLLGTGNLAPGVGGNLNIAA
jgi:putative motility protein YjfB-like